MARMPFRRLALVLAIAGLALQASCASGGGGRIYGGGTAQLVIVNGGGETIMRIYTSSSSTRSWGPDQLGAAVLERGASFTISNITPGQWDVRIVDRSGNTKEFRRQMFRGGRSYTLQVNSQGWVRGN